MKKNLIPAIVILIVIVILGFVAFRLKGRVSTTPTKTPVTWSGLSNKGQVLFVSPSYGLAIGNADGSNLKKFNKNIDSNLMIVRDYGVSPDGQQIFFRTTPRVSTSSATSNFYLAFLDGSSVKEFSQTAIKALGKDFEIINFVWSRNSKSLLLEASDLSKGSFSLNTGSKETSITHYYFSYSPDTGEVHNIYKDSAKYLKASFYDASKNQLAYTSDGGSFLVNTLTGDKIKLTGIVLDQLNGDGSKLATLDGNFVNIYKTSDLPAGKLASVDVSGVGTATLSGLITWSSKCEKLAISFIDRKTNKSFARVYDTSGRLLSTISDFDVQNGSIFSNDSSKFLAVHYAGNSKENYYQTAWRQFDTATGEPASTEKITSDLSFAVYWY